VIKFHCVANAYDATTLSRNCVTNMHHPDGIQPVRARPFDQLFGSTPMQGSLAGPPLHTSSCTNMAQTQGHWMRPHWIRPHWIPPIGHFCVDFPPGLQAQLTRAPQCLRVKLQMFWHTQFPLIASHFQCKSLNHQPIQSINRKISVGGRDGGWGHLWMGIWLTGVQQF